MEKEPQVKNPGTVATAETILSVGDIIKQRSGTHGDAHKNLADIAQRWSRYISKTYGVTVDMNVADVAYLMVEMKLSRATYGDNAEIDHFMDIIGYAGIGASFVKKLKAKSSPELSASGDTTEVSKATGTTPVGG